MVDIQLIKDGITLIKTLGIMHALRRCRDKILIEKESKRRTRLYDRIKPKNAITKEILGNKMQLDMSDYGIHRDLFLDGIREPVATRYLTEVLSKDDVVLEIGANIGYYVLIESKLCKKIYAVEPIPKNIKNLNINIKLNQCKNAEVFELAFGEEKRKRAMNISPKSNRHSFYPMKDTIKKIYVETDTVDNFLKDKEPPTFVRMDVEGFELYILKGMKETLKKVNRLFIEVHSLIMKSEETKELITMLQKEKFYPEKIIQYDKPKFSRVLPNDYINRIYQGDKGAYLIFFKRKI